MAGLQISRSDVEQLARKLDSLGSHFTESEWSMLSAVFELATTAVGTTGPGVTDAPAAAQSSAAAPLASFSPGKDEEDDGFVPDKIGRASLHDQVLRSYTPGKDEESASGPGTGAGPGPDKIGRA